MTKTKLNSRPILLFLWIVGAACLIWTLASSAETKIPQHSPTDSDLENTPPKQITFEPKASVKSNSQAADFIDWSEETLYTVVKAAEEASRIKDWQTSISRGEQALEGCLEIAAEKDPRCILIMKNNIVAYNQADQVLSHAKEIEHAYRLAQNELGGDHYSTIIIREVFHKLLLDQGRYTETIPVVIDLIDEERSTTNDEFEILNWYIQLYALYKVEGIVANKPPTLERMLKLTDKLIGKKSDDYKRVTKVLAETYCEQEMYYEFYTFVKKQRLKIGCKN